MRHQIEDWLEQDDLGNPGPLGGQPADPNAQMPMGTGLGDNNGNPNAQPPQQADQQGGEDQEQDDVTQDPPAPDMPEEENYKNFEDWKRNFFKESIKGDVTTLRDLLDTVVAKDLEAYPKKFVNDNLYVVYLRENANIDRASKQIRQTIKKELDQNNPSTTLVKHLFNTLINMPELNNIFVRMLPLEAWKGEAHRKFLASLFGAVQVGNGANGPDIIFNEKKYSINISTRMHSEFGRVNLSRWSFKQDDPDKFLKTPELKRLEEGSPEEKDALRRRCIMESIADDFDERAFLVTVVGTDGTIFHLGWDIANCLRNGYSDGKLVVRTKNSENSEAMITDDGKILPSVDYYINYVKNSENHDAEGKPLTEEINFIKREDGMLFLVADLKTLQEASSRLTGIVLKENPYRGNPADLKILGQVNQSLLKLALGLP